MKKENFHQEYMLNAGSGRVIWDLISTPTGMETWFADKVHQRDKTFCFTWGKTETREATISHIRANSFIRFHWDDDTENPKSYFELKMSYNELTNFYTLEITDTSTADTPDELAELWDSQIEKMRRVSGL